MTKSVSTANASSAKASSANYGLLGLGNYAGRAMGYDMPIAPPSKFGYEADPIHERVLMLAMYNKQRGARNYMGDDKKDYLKRVHEMPAAPPAKSNSKDIGGLTDELLVSAKKGANVSYASTESKYASNGAGYAGRSYNAVAY